MIGIGALLALLGAGSLILPEMGYQLRIMEPLEDAQPFAGIAIIVVGIALIAFGIVRKNKAKEQESLPPYN